MPFRRDPDHQAARSLFNDHMGGHLFVLRGDLTKLHCSGLLIPCDTDWNVVKKNWAGVLPKGSLGEVVYNGWAPFRAAGTGRFTDAVTDGDRWVRLVVTADDDSFAFPDNEEYEDLEETAQWVADGVVEAIDDWSRRIPMPAGRVKRLIGLPLVATGDGGLKERRGVLIHALIPKLQKAARDHDVDIALVLRDEPDHAAVQAVRSDYWTDFADEQPELAKHLDAADELGHKAAHGELSLFLGSGVSVPLGVPDWERLLTALNRGKKIKGFRPDKAPRIAQKIAKKHGRRKFHRRIAHSVDVRGVAPAHMLLAALSVNQTVTTNYDTAYERALKSTVGRGKFRVLTKQLALQPEPWVLKYHGCAKRPKTIVITRDDYSKLRKEHGSLQSLVESLMMTSHLMFVGFSMGDPDFVKAAKRVNRVRALARDKDAPPVATVLALHPRSVSSHADFKVVSMLDDPSDQSAARRLEIFLDRISWKAATSGSASSSYLLHPDYQDLFADEDATKKLRRRLVNLIVKLEDDDIRLARGWDKVEKMLKQLGAGEREHNF